MSNRSVPADGSATKGHGLARNAVRVVIVLATVAGVCGVAQLPARKQEVPPAEIPAVKVSVMTVAAAPELADAFDLPGVVEPNRVVTVSAEVDGRVEWIGPKKGTLVHTGDPLIRLNTDFPEAQFQMAQAQAKNNQTEFERIKGLVEKGAAPSRDMDAAATQSAISKAQLEEARIRLDRAGLSPR